MNAAFYPLGERMVLVEFEPLVSVAVNQKVHNYAAHIRKAKLGGVLQVIPAFSSLCVEYNPLQVSFHQLVQQLQSLDSPSCAEVRTDRIFHIPVAYGGSLGEDLPSVAGLTGKTEQEVISLHAGTTYNVYMLGFIAGCPYCGELDESLAIPRRKEPRLRVEKGSIGIANRQTFVYSVGSPGGWNIIGRTPMKTFDPFASPPTPFAAGQQIKFIPISEGQFAQWDDKEQMKWDAQWNG